ncbi:hypothetical protein [Streptomyces sp. KR80]|uniref:hypothetical protein n=1 Tax=Streptomyces sp. KR80 TaxID=3457426 RepID=UPI003FD0E08E
MAALTPTEYDRLAAATAFTRALLADDDEGAKVILESSSEGDLCDGLCSLAQILTQFGMDMDLKTDVGPRLREALGSEDAVYRAITDMVVNGRTDDLHTAALFDRVLAECTFERDADKELSSTLEVISRHVEW